MLPSVMSPSGGPMRNWIPAAMAAAAALFGLPPALDMAEDLTGYDIRGRKRRAARGAAAMARGAGARYAREGLEESVQGKYLDAGLDRMGPARGRGIGEGERAAGMGTILSDLEERHAASLGAVEGAKKLPMSLQELAIRAGMRG